MKNYLTVFWLAAALTVVSVRALNAQALHLPVLFVASMELENYYDNTGSHDYTVNINEISVRERKIAVFIGEDILHSVSILSNKAEIYKEHYYYYLDNGYIFFDFSQLPKGKYQLTINGSMNIPLQIF